VTVSRRHLIDLYTQPASNAFHDAASYDGDTSRVGRRKTAFNRLVLMTARERYTHNQLVTPTL